MRNGAEVLQEPREYYHFNTLLSRAGETLAKRKTMGNHGSYYDHLTMVAQLIDHTSQSPLIDQLRDQTVLVYANTSTSSDSRSSQVHEARVQYWKNLQNESAYTALQAVRHSEDAMKQHEYGYQGGFLIDPNSDVNDLVKDTVASLGDLDSKLLNFGLLNEAFIDNWKPFVLDNIKQTFGEYGYDVYSPEYRLAMLYLLEYYARTHMMEPIFATIEKYSDVTVKLPGFDAKKGVFQKMLVGNRQEKSYVTTKTPEKYYGTEYYRGLLDRILENKKSLIESLGEHGEDIDYLVSEALFLRVSQRESGQRAADLRGKVIAPMSRGDYEGAKAALRQLIVDNPGLYRFPLKYLGITQGDVMRRQTEILRHEGEQRRLIQLFKEEQERSEREARLAVGKSTALWERITPFVGRVGTTKDGGTVIITGQTKVKPRNSDESSVEGFAKITYVSHPSSFPHMKRRSRSAAVTYGKIVENIESGEWVFPK